MQRPHSFPVSLAAQDDNAARDARVLVTALRRLPWLGLGFLALATSAARGAENCLAMNFAPSTMSVGIGVNSLLAADFDRDGDIDVWVPEATGIRRMTNLGNDTFAVSMLDVGGAAASLASGDVDGDGDLDVLVAMNTSMRLLSNHGSGSFALGPATPFANNDSAPVGTWLGDLDGDTRLDAVIAVNHVSVGASYTGGLIVARGAGDGSFTLLPTHSLQLPAGRSELADFNGDGMLDVAVLGGYVTWSTIALSYGNGDGTFTAAPTTLSAGLYAGAFGSGDLDGDGAVDLVYGNKYSFHVLHNDGTGAFTASGAFNIGSYGKGCSIADIDHDGDLDVAATSGGGSAIRILLNDGSGNLTATHSLAASIQCYAVLLADTTGDGVLDPWAIDVTTGQLFRGTSHCIAARYGDAKVNSLGCLPTMGILGTPSVASANFAITTTHELESQPALVLIGLSGTDFTALGGHVLVAAPWTMVLTSTSAGSGNPSVCDGVVELAIPGSSLALAPLGTQVFVQVLAADPFQSDSSMASLSDGLRFEITP